MKVDQFKNLIKESIKEVLVEEGLLKEVISAVIQETQQAQQPIVAKQKETFVPNLQDVKNSNANKMNEMRQKMMESIGKSSYSNLYNLEGVDLFEGTKPLGRGGVPSEGSQPQGALSGVEPDDAGVSIDSLLGNKHIWQQLINKK